MSPTHTLYVSKSSMQGSTPHPSTQLGTCLAYYETLPSIHQPIHQSTCRGRERGSHHIHKPEGSKSEDQKQRWALVVTTAGKNQLLLPAPFAS
mmetsp:Transcript_35994/g.89749  ORF Transcript_35994/g.89749 Transcript_35994/m.89749 type:complete len:93 (+) Transcript_35994:497-775(+)